MITPKKKLRGNMKTSCDPTISSSFHRGNHPTPLAFMLSLQSQSEFSFKGVGMFVMETLIKVISKYLGANTILNPKVEFKNEVYDSNYRKINPNPMFKGHSNF
jgi:hypothetical protein